jgi:hypothetical protein
MELIEGSVYQYEDRYWIAMMVGASWCLRLLADAPYGDVAAFRQVDGCMWRECRYAPAPMGEELFYGSTVTIDPASLMPVELPDDDAFFELMGPLTWEWS